MPQPSLAHVLGAMLVMVAALASDASAQMFVPAGRDTLRGLPGVEVMVEDLQPELEREGLTGAGIRDDVVRRLEAGGITVYASQRENPSPAKPYLYVHLNALPLPRQAIYAVAIQVQLRQTLGSPVTGSSIVNAMTWDSHNLVLVPAASLQALREEILSYLDQFVGDWTAMRPEN